MQENGYDTISFEQGMENATVIVVSGMDSDLFGDERITTDATVIEAAGLTAEEVLEEVKRAMKFVH